MKYNLDKRTFIKSLGITFFSFFLIPFKFAKAVAKKVINENLTKKQKEIMFNEGTERPFTSDLLNEEYARKFIRGIFPLYYLLNLSISLIVVLLIAYLSDFSLKFYLMLSICILFFISNFFFNAVD